MRIKHILFSSFICIFLLGPFLLLVSTNILKIDLPQWLNGSDSIYLIGSQQDEDLVDVLSIESIVDGSFQDHIQKTLENSIPLKTNMLLANSLLQREAISLSNCIFNWSCYPTHYGSNMLYIPEKDALTVIAHNKQDTLGKIKIFSDKLNEFAHKYPDKTFCVILADHPETSAINPSHELRSGTITTKDCLNVIESSTRDSSNINVSAYLYNDINEYYDDFYTTDHHWNGYGATKSFNNIAEMLGEEPIENSKYPVGYFDNLVFNGTYSRFGLMLLNESINEPKFQLSNIETPNIDKNDCTEGFLYSEDGQKFLNMDELSTAFNFYSLWYYGMNNLKTTNNEKTEKALLVGDSFSYPFRWLVGENYKEMYSALDLTSGLGEGSQLDQRIAESNPDVIYFVAWGADYANLLDKAPDYF